MALTGPKQYQFKRWQRYGKDRLYVIRTIDGVQLGYFDFATGALNPESPATTDQLRSAVEWWGQPTNVPPATQATAPIASTDITWGATSTLTVLPSPNPPASRSAPTPPRLVDLIYSAPGASLQGPIAAARTSGHIPTFRRRPSLRKYAYSSWESGATGEWLVAAELANLRMQDPRWGFLNSIPVGSNNADIDHLAIGPGGVFTINAKHHLGMKVWVGGNTLMVNGVRQPYIRNSRHEAKRAEKLLARAAGINVTVLGLIVPVNTAECTVRAQPDDVTVISHRRLAKHLLQLPERLTRSAVESLFEHARQSSTWIS